MRTKCFIVVVCKGYLDCYEENVDGVWTRIEGADRRAAEINRKNKRQELGPYERGWAEVREAVLHC